MRLSNKAINDFKRIYFEEFGIKLTDDETNQKGLRLLNFIKLIYRPIPTINCQKMSEK
jgi:hypothetical protein